jgi:hypothetical protein
MREPSAVGHCRGLHQNMRTRGRQRQAWRARERKSALEVFNVRRLRVHDRYPTSAIRQADVTSDLTVAGRRRGSIRRRTPRRPAVKPTRPGRSWCPDHASRLEPGTWGLKDLSSATAVRGWDQPAYMSWSAIRLSGRARSLEHLDTHGSAARSPGVEVYELPVQHGGNYVGRHV